MQTLTLKKNGQLKICNTVINVLHQRTKVTAYPVFILNFVFQKRQWYICNDVEKTKLTLLRKYRLWTSGLILLLYSFIAMPVQFWHKHLGKAKSSVVISVNKNSSYSSFNKDGSSLSDNCKICSHHYSVYSNDHCQTVLVVLPVQKCSQHFSFSSLLETENLPFSNKGPPVVIC